MPTWIDGSRKEETEKITWGVNEVRSITDRRRTGNFMKHYIGYALSKKEIPSEKYWGKTSA